MAKTTPPLTAQERVILFCTATVCRYWHHRARDAVHDDQGIHRSQS
jgi:hypothetical protein